MKYLVHWLHGKVEEIEGDSPADAFRKAGIGAGALPAVDYWETISDPYTGNISEVIVQATKDDIAGRKR